jgi:hypothetical protein
VGHRGFQLRREIEIGAQSPEALAALPGPMGPLRLQRYKITILYLQLNIEVGTVLPYKSGVKPSGIRGCSDRGESTPTGFQPVSDLNISALFGT